MKKFLVLILVSFLFSGCSLFRTHKLDVEQGNIITQEDASQLRIGMTADQVKDIMGTPVLENIFDAHRMNYVYTFQEGYGQMKITKLTCIFLNGRLKTIDRT